MGQLVSLALLLLRSLMLKEVNLQRKKNFFYLLDFSPHEISHTRVRLRQLSVSTPEDTRQAAKKYIFVVEKRKKNTWTLGCQNRTEPTQERDHEKED